MSQSHDAMVARIVGEYIEPEKLYLAYSERFGSYVAPFHILILHIFDEYRLVMNSLQSICDTISNKEKYIHIANYFRIHGIYHRIHEIDGKTNMIGEPLPIKRIIEMIEQYI